MSNDIFIQFKFGKDINNERIESTARTKTSPNNQASNGSYPVLEVMGSAEWNISKVDEEDLVYFLGLVKEASLPYSLVQDAGLTEIAPGTVTVLGVGPAPRHTMDHLFSELKTYD